MLMIVHTPLIMSPMSMIFYVIVNFETENRKSQEQFEAAGALNQGS